MDGDRVESATEAQSTTNMGNYADREIPRMAAASTAIGAATVVINRIYFHTEGNADIVNLTAEVRRIVKETGLTDGAVTVFFPGATGAITTLEFEPGVVQDFANLFDRIISPNEHYEHNVTHPDVNGHAHVRAGLLGPSLVFPFEKGELCLGQWQEICFVCFDNRPRERTVIVQALGVR
jgi:secondary thiamine-phosphate synthase enzyme